MSIRRHPDYDLFVRAGKMAIFMGEPLLGAERNDLFAVIGWAEEMLKQERRLDPETSPFPPVDIDSPGESRAALPPMGGDPKPRPGSMSRSPAPACTARPLEGAGTPRMPEPREHPDGREIARKS